MGLLPCQTVSLTGLDSHKAPILWAAGLETEWLTSYFPFQNLVVYSRLQGHLPTQSLWSSSVISTTVSSLLPCFQCYIMLCDLFVYVEGTYMYEGFDLMHIQGYRLSRNWHVGQVLYVICMITSVLQNVFFRFFPLISIHVCLSWVFLFVVCKMRTPVSPVLVIIGEWCCSQAPNKLPRYICIGWGHGCESEYIYKPADIIGPIINVSSIMSYSMYYGFVLLFISFSTYCCFRCLCGVCVCVSEWYVSFTK